MSSKPRRPPTRMGLRLVDPYPDKPKGPELKVPDPYRLDKAVKKLAKKKPASLHATVLIDDQYNGRVYFSEAFGEDAGATWSEPLEIEDRTEWANKEFFWRIEIDQYRVDPLLQGFKTLWQIRTPGWSFVDGLGSTLFDEAISNPLKITRVIKSPGTISVRPKFRIVVVQKYKP